MPITTDTILAGMQSPKSLIKSGATTAAVGALRGYTPRYVAGNPGASTASAVGINGAAVVGATNGAIPRTNPAGGVNAYLARFGINVNTPGVMWLIDRLWDNSGLSTTLTTAQAITPAALPARSGDGTVNGAQVMAAVEWSVVGGAGTPTVTLTYTNEAGTAGRTATLAGVTTPPVGTFEIFTLAGSDTGVRAPTSFIQSATRTSGTMHLVLFRLLGMVEVTSANIGNAIDALTGGRPEIFDDSHLQLLWFPSATTAPTIIGSYVETHVTP